VEADMATAAASSIGALRHNAPRPLGQLLRDWRARFIDMRRQRYEDRRMRRMVQAIDHAGVLADMQAACGATRH
jgi:hypothetical protein